MQIRSFRGSGEPAWVNARLPSARDCLGPDPRRALGPAATNAAPTGRTRDRTRPTLQNVRKFLPGRRPHVTQLGHRTEIWGYVLPFQARRAVSPGGDEIQRWLLPSVHFTRGKVFRCVPGSAMYLQTTLSRYTFFPPIVPLGGSSRGT